MGFGRKIVVNLVSEAFLVFWVFIRPPLMLLGIVMLRNHCPGFRIWVFVFEDAPVVLVFVPASAT